MLYLVLLLLRSCIFFVFPDHPSTKQIKEGQVNQSEFICLAARTFWRNASIWVVRLNSACANLRLGPEHRIKAKSKCLRPLIVAMGTRGDAPLAAIMLETMLLARSRNLLGASLSQ